MRNFIGYVRDKFSVVIPAKDNSELELPCITLQNIPGTISIAKVNGKREAEFLAMFNSYSKDRDEAYNQLLKLQENLLDEDGEYYAGNGYEIDCYNISDIADMTFIESERNLYRYQMQVRVSYTRQVN